MVHTQAPGHRLHRLPPPVQQQTPQIQLALHPLVSTRQRCEHLPGELLQPATTRDKFIRPRTRRKPPEPLPAQTRNNALLGHSAEAQKDGTS